MKKGALAFLGRKSQSLFDTSVQMKDMDNVELVLDAPVIPESGTASVRARPTVKHHASSDSFQGCAVPTPKVPLLPPVNGPKANGSVCADRLSNGSVISVPDAVEGEIFVPPPPSVAPPPPPGTFILPPPDFIGDLNGPELATLPKSTPFTHPTEEELAFLKPPPMAPPKPPSTSSTGSASSIPMSTPPAAKIPEHPKYAPPQPPPAEKQLKTHKTPPTKPIRLSSMSSIDLPPQNPAPPPPVPTPTLSTFNPQNTAKLYSVPQTSVLSGYENRDTRPKQMLLLEDSGPKSVPVLVQVDGKTLNVAAQEIEDGVQITPPSQASPPEPRKEANTGAVLRHPKMTKPLLTPPQKSPQPSKDNPHELSVSNFSLLDHKLRNLKSSENSAAREGPAASPLALLMAAKEREKHRPAQSLSRENSEKRNEQPSASIYPSDTSPNSFVVVPTPSSVERLNSEDMQIIQTPEKSGNPALIRDQIPSTGPSRSRMTTAASLTDLLVQKHNAEQRPPKSQLAQPEDSKEEINVPLLPPPPEFDDLEEIMEPPPSIPPPDPPVKKAPPPPVSLPPVAPGPPPPKPKPPALPVTESKPKPQIQTKPQKPPNKLPTPLSPSQVTLLSILQKKMLEMDHKMAPVKETESSSDDWGSPLSDEENNIPVVPKTTPPSKTYPVVNKTASLDMRELEGKVAKQKKQETSSAKAPTSNGPSKHQYGMTFTIRPGTKQPITPYSPD